MTRSTATTAIVTALCALLAVLATAATPAHAAGVASIAGHVVNMDTYAVVAYEPITVHDPASGHTATTTSDAGGYFEVHGLPVPGTYQVLPASGGGEVIEMTGPGQWDITLLAYGTGNPPPPAGPCDGSDPATGLTDVGFESGTTAAWSEEVVTDDVAVTGADAFASPWEGTKMLRLGRAYDGYAVRQDVGSNEVCQRFVVDEAVERFAYQVVTYDYTGYDEFSFDLTVVAGGTEERIAGFAQHAWGPSGNVNLKRSGWRGVTLDLADHLGETVELRFDAAGTHDRQYGFWVYVDSAELAVPPPGQGLVDVASGSASAMNDPTTGLVTVAVPKGDVGDVPLVVTAACPGGATPGSVVVGLDGATFPATAIGGGTWSATIPAASVAEGDLSVVASCPGGTSSSATVGSIELYDPSGFVTDALSGLPVVGAEVTLHEVPGWTPATQPGQTGPTTCQTNLSKPAGSGWTQPAPVGAGVVANPHSGKVSPQVNPFLTDEAGHYGWDVAQGCWYVTVEALGYQPYVSPVVGVPTAVTDLHVQLVPLEFVGFTDVGPTHRFAGDISWMARRGITTGYADGSFRPTASVTRQAMAAFLHRLEGEPEVDLPATPTFVDVPASHPFHEAIEWMVAEGVAGGYPDGSFRPTAPVSRQAMAAFLHRLAGEPVVDLPATPTFADVPAGHPFHEAIEWMVAEEVAGGYPDGSFRPTAPVSRQAMSAFVHRYDAIQAPA